MSVVQNIKFNIGACIKKSLCKTFLLLILLCSKHNLFIPSVTDNYWNYVLQEANPYPKSAHINTVLICKLIQGKEAADMHQILGFVLLNNNSKQCSPKLPLVWIRLSLAASLYFTNGLSKSCCQPCLLIATLSIPSVQPAGREGEGHKPEQSDFPSAFSYLESQEAFIRNEQLIVF